MAAPKPMTRPVGAVMRSVAIELTRVRDDIRAMEEAIGHILAFAAPQEVPTQIQQMDRIVQEIDDLARFCAVAGEGLDDGLRFDATAALAALKLRQLAHAMGAHDAFEPAPGGDVHLF